MTASGESELLLHLQTEVLEAIAYGDSISVICNLLCRRAEGLAPKVRCSILQVDDADILHTIAGPSLPAAYNRAVDGLAAGAKAGSCGTAAYRNEAVLVSDIASDPLWDDYRQLALPLELKACWSSPIRDHSGKVVATFAFYYNTPRGPTELERRIVETCVHLCAIAIDHEQVQTRNHRLAYFDALTGLPNRSNFTEMLDCFVSEAKPFGLLLVDIDQLKITNDTIGQASGDLLISTMAQRIAGTGLDAVVSRIGGDEFAVIVRQCADAATLEEAASQILAASRGLMHLGAHVIDPNVTLGGALFGADGSDADTLRQNADFAMSHAKATARGSYLRFQPALRISMVERFNLVRSVNLALAEQRVVPHYQPIVRLDDNQIVGLEALARIRTLEGKILSAGEFNAALSDPQIAYQLTGQMLRQVAGDVRCWLDAGVPFQHVGINVTTGDFQRGDLEARIVEIFDEMQVPLRHVILEVNEAVFMGGSDKMVPRAVEALRQRGLLVALDDFGTGYASLTHLLSFPVDVIKIDKSFVDRIDVEGPNTVIVEAIIEIARKLDMRVVAEGIETRSQQQRLGEMGCALGQGYLFSRPVSADAIHLMMMELAQRPRVA